MVTIMKVAQYALYADDRHLYILLEDFIKSYPIFKEVPYPETTDSRTLSVAAGLLELLSIRYSQEPPNWTSTIGGLPEPFFIRKSAVKNQRLREICLNESPEPLKKRNIFSSANFLIFA